MNNLQEVKTINSQAGFPLTCSIAHRIDSMDFICLVCKEGPKYGSVGQILSYRGTRVTLAFLDGTNELFRGPSLERLSEPSLKEHEVELFYIGDLNRNRNPSSEPKRINESYASMAAIDRTHIGLMRLSNKMIAGQNANCAARVQDILKSSKLNYQNIK